MNYATGFFIAPTTGDYLITYSLYASNLAGQAEIEIYIMKNNAKIPESHHLSRYSGSSGYAYDQGNNHKNDDNSVGDNNDNVMIIITGGRSLILHMMTKGQSTSLYCLDCSAFIGRITFCVSLLTPTSG